MCGLCGMFESGRRWLDAAATLDPSQVRRERLRRVAIVRQVLKPARIAVDDWEGASFILRGPTGRTEIVDNLFDLWRKADVLGHRALDPLTHASGRSPVPPPREGETIRPACGEKESVSVDTEGPTQNGRLPLHVLTGFLGSGKTTLLNRMLRAPALADSAVLINEIGAIAIDHHLVQSIEPGKALDIVVLKGGCTCCTVRGDLVDALRELYARRANATAAPFCRVVLETSGLADPAPVLFTLAGDPALRHKFALGAVIATVDAIHGATQLARHPESRKQIAVADRLVVTKTDLADEPGAAALVAALRRMNPAAEIIDGQELDDVQRLLGGARALDTPTLWSPDAHTMGSDAHVGNAMHDAEHTPDVDSTAFVVDEPVEWSAFAIWLTLLLHSHGDKMLRFKALLRVEEWPAEVALDGVHHLVHPPIHLAARAGRRPSRLVFIAQGLQVARIEPSLRDFLASNRRHDGRSGGSPRAA